MKERIEAEKKVIVKAQLYIGNDLFKVVEFDRVIPEICVPLPSAHVDWNVFTKALTIKELPQATFSKIVFEFDGIIEKQDNVIIARYHYAGGA